MGFATFVLPYLSTMLTPDQPVQPIALKHLAIVTTPDGFLFYDVDQPGLSALALTLEAPFDFPDSFEHYVTASGWAQDPNLRVSISQHSNRFMVIPASINDPSQVRALFETAFIKGKEADLSLFPMSDGKQAFCCELPSSHLETYKRMFNHVAVFNPTFLMAEWVFREARTRQETIMLAYHYGQSLHLLVANPDKWLFLNVFTLRSEQDALYFTLRVMEQLNLDPFTLQAYIGSPLQHQPPLFAALEPYLKERTPFIYTGLPEAPVCTLVI